MVTPYYPEFVVSPSTGDDVDGKDYSTFVRVCYHTNWYRVHLLHTVRRSCPELSDVLKVFMKHAHEITNLFIISEETSMWWEKDPCQMLESERLVAVEQLKQEYAHRNFWKDK